jgi:hypothetical protein
MPEPHPLNACADHTDMYRIESKNRRDILNSLMVHDVSFAPEETADAVRLEIWHSTFTNPAPEDYSTYELYDIDSNLIAQHRVNGY